jgi:hypothetical protein
MLDRWRRIVFMFTELVRKRWMKKMDERKK